MSNINNYKPLMQFNDGNPFLLFSDKIDLNAFVLSSYFDDSWTDLPFKGIFIPMLVKMIKYAAFNIDINKNQFIVGNEIVINTSQGNVNMPYELVTVTNEKNRITPVFSGSNVTFDLQDIVVPGNYKIQQGSEILSVISANVDLDKLVDNNDNIELISENENVYEKVKESRFGEEIWKYIIGLALLILLFESFVVKKIEGKI